MSEVVSTKILYHENGAYLYEVRARLKDGRNIRFPVVATLFDDGSFGEEVLEQTNGIMDLVEGALGQTDAGRWSIDRYRGLRDLFQIVRGA